MATAAISTSQEIRDRGSIFVATIHAATSPTKARAAAQRVRQLFSSPWEAASSSAPATSDGQVAAPSKAAHHYIFAYRCMVVKRDRTGLADPEDFELQEGSEDDGERWGGAKVLRVMQQEAVLDAVVVVRRWYGGVLLGPARFAHIETCARDVCHAFRRREEVEECIGKLRTLDSILAGLRTELKLYTPLAATATLPTTPFESSSVSAQTAATTTVATTTITVSQPDYDTLLVDLDLARAKRLVVARQKAVDTVRASLEKKKVEAGILPPLS